MTREKRTCAATDCSTPVPYGMLMCKPHWFSVPAPVRRRVNAAWSAVSTALNDPSDRAAFAEIVTAYRNAVADAVAAVQSSLP